MKKFSKIGKRVLAFFLVALMNINVYATSASNDGSQFVTKAEFDALVTDFNTQMDTYQSGMNAKIDSAIATYLAGMAGVSQSKREIVLPNSVAKGVLSISKKAPLDYVYGTPYYKGWYCRTDFQTTNANTASMAYFQFSGSPSSDLFKIKKTTISSIKESTTAGASTAKWDGYYIDCLDQVVCGGQESNTAYNGISTWQGGGWEPEGTYIIKNQNLINSGSSLAAIRSVWGDTSHANNGIVMSLKIMAINHTWGTNTTPYVSVLESYDYDMFSNYDRDKNWGYDGDYMTDFRGETWNKQQVTSKGAWSTDTGCYTRGLGTVSATVHGQPPSGTNVTTGSGSGSVYGVGIPKDSTAPKTFYVPMVGFERTYLTNWKQIYDGNTNIVAEFENTKHGSESGASNRAILTDASNDRYIGLSGGYPLMKLNSKEKLNYKLIFEDKNVNYVVWFSNRPFNTTGHPDDDANCLTNITGLNKATNTSKGYVVVEGEGEFTTEEMTEDCYLYIKWGINAEEKADIAGGRLMPTKTGTIMAGK